VGGHPRRGFVLGAEPPELVDERAADRGVLNARERVLDVDQG
jgi:hypothetical protein